MRKSKGVTLNLAIAQTERCRFFSQNFDFSYQNYDLIWAEKFNSVSFLFSFLLFSGGNGLLLKVDVIILQ